VTFPLVSTMVRDVDNFARPTRRGRFHGRVAHRRTACPPSASTRSLGDAGVTSGVSPERGAGV